MTVRQSILEAMLSALNAGSPTPVCERDRGLDSVPGSAGAMTIRPFEDLGERIGPQSVVMSRTLIAAVECRALAAADGSPTATEALEPLLERVTAKLGGSRLGGLVREVLDVRIRFEQVQGDVRVAKATAYVTARYQTLVNDATSRT